MLGSCQTNNKEIKINGSLENFEVVRLDQVLSKNIDEIHKVYLKYPELYINFFTNFWPFFGPISGFIGQFGVKYPPQNWDIALRRRHKFF